MRKTRPRALYKIWIVLIGLFVSGCGPGQFLGPTITPSPTATPTPTLTPTLTPTATLTPTPESTSTYTPQPQASFIVIESAIRGDAFGVVIQDKDSNGNGLDVLTVGVQCLTEVFYVVDETGKRLKCTNVSNQFQSGKPNRIGMIFTGASSEHQYQLVIPGVPPIDLEPKQA